VEFKTTLLAVPVQMVCGLADPVGLALTVTVAVIGLPTQNEGEGPVGVMVNVTVTSAVVVFVKAAPVIFPEPLAAMPVTLLVLFLVHA